MNTGFRFRMRLIFEQVFCRKSRLILTFLGVFLPLLLILCSFFLLDSFYYSDFEKIGWLKKNGVVAIKMSTFDEKSESFFKLTELFSDEYLGLKQRKQIVLEYPIVLNEKEKYINLVVCSANVNFSGDIVMDSDGIHNSKLVDGRKFSKDDFVNESKVIIIGNALARMMFGDDYLGKTLLLPYSSFITITESNLKRIDTNVSFEIIGTYDDEELISEVDYGEKTYLSEYVYIPWNVSLIEDEQRTLPGECVFMGIDALDFEQTQFLLSDSMISSYTNYEKERQIIVEQNKSLKSAAGIASIILSVISMMMIGQAMLFSTKERLPEFGIKRAIGAGAGDIALDLIMETLIYTFIAFTAAFICAVLGALVFLNIATMKGYISDIHFVLTSRSICTAALLAVFTGLSSVLYPLIYVNCKNIEDAIRFE